MYVTLFARIIVTEQKTYIKTDSPLVMELASPAVGLSPLLRFVGDDSISPYSFNYNWMDLMNRILLSGSGYDPFFLWTELYHDRILSQGS